MVVIYTIHRILGWINVRPLSLPAISPLDRCCCQRSLCQAILFLIFGRSRVFITLLGFFALGLESTLPIPQLIRYIMHSISTGSRTSLESDPPWSCSNYKQRSLYGFRMSTLIGWLGGDSFKLDLPCEVLCQSILLIKFVRTVYFFLQNSPLQFKVCAIFQLSIDFGMLFHNPITVAS